MTRGAEGGGDSGSSANGSDNRGGSDSADGGRRNGSFGGSNGDRGGTNGNRGGTRGESDGNNGENGSSNGENGNSNGEGGDSNGESGGENGEGGGGNPNPRDCDPVKDEAIPRPPKRDRDNDYYWLIPTIDTPTSRISASGGHGTETRPSGPSRVAESTIGGGTLVPTLEIGNFSQ